MTEPHRPMVDDDLDLGMSAALPPPDAKRKAANARQREAALAEEEHERWYAALKARIWGPQ